MDDEEKEDTAAPKPKKLILTNPLVLIGIVIVFQAAIAFMMVKMIGSNNRDEVQQAEPEAKVEKPEETGTRGTIVMLPDIVVNLTERDKLYYLKVTIGLEVPDEKVQAEVTERQAQLRDDVISLLSGKKVTDIDTLEERNALKTELTRRINESLLSGDLMQLYFSDFVIQ